MSAVPKLRHMLYHEDCTSIRQSPKVQYMHSQKVFFLFFKKYRRLVLYQVLVAVCVPTSLNPPIKDIAKK